MKTGIIILLLSLCVIAAVIVYIMLICCGRAEKMAENSLKKQDSEVQNNDSVGGGC